MRTDMLAEQADQAVKALEEPRVELERWARRWAQRRTLSALEDLLRAADGFDQAQRRGDEAIRAWARVLALEGTHLRSA